VRYISARAGSKAQQADVDEKTAGLVLDVFNEYFAGCLIDGHRADGVDSRCGTGKHANRHSISVRTTSKHEDGRLTGNNVRDVASRCRPAAAPEDRLRRSAYQPANVPAVAAKYRVVDARSRLPRRRPQLLGRG
jgi:hypothetical protein